MLRFTPFLLLGLMFGCAKGPELEPAPEAAGNESEAFGQDAGVKVTVDPKNWYGLDIHEPELTELYVELDNDSGRPLLLRYEDFHLVAADGRTWQAADPSRPDMVDLGLKNELLERGAVQRVVEDLENDSIQGNLYFSGVDPRLDRVTLHVRLVDARTGDAFGSIQIPFTVEGNENGDKVSQAQPAK